MAASADLLDYLCRKQDWFPKLIKVLRVEELKLNHLADIFEKIKGNVEILFTNTLTTLTKPFLFSLDYIFDYVNYLQ